MVNVSDDEFAVVIISLTMFCLIIMYSTLSISAIKRKIIQSDNAIALGKTFYSFLLILCFVRILAWVALTIELWAKMELVSEVIVYNQLNKLLLTIRYIPETLFVITFMILLWNVLVLYHVCHMRVDRQLRDVSLPPLNAFGKSVLSVTITAVFFAQGVISFLFWMISSWTPETYIYANGLMNMFAPGFLICVELYLHCKFSGVPYKSIDSRKRLLRVNLILIFWGICQGLTGGLKFFEEDKEQQIFQAILGKGKAGSLISRLLGPVIFVSLLFFLEVLPIILVTDSKTTENFLIKQEIEDEINSHFQGLNASLAENDSENSSSKVTIITSGGLGGKNTDESMIKSGPKWITSNQNVVLTKIHIAEKKDGKLGELFQCFYGSESLFARVITCDKITKYVAEQLTKEISKFRKLDSRYLLKIRGHYHDDFSITILYDTVENKSLHNLLHNNKDVKKTLEDRLKGKFVMQIAAALQVLHSQNPPILHGHLTSSNVLLDKEFNIKLTDYGLPSLKKYMSVKTGYTIMDSSIPPEHLSENAKYISIADTSADIYAFGFLLWEIFACDQPFGNISTKELFKLVVNEKSRPKIPKDFPEDLANLIRACWQNDPKKRPTIDRIIDNLNQMDGRFSD